MKIPFELINFSLSVERCPICGPSLFIKLAANEISIRCFRCRSTPITLSLISAIQTILPKLYCNAAYEMSSRGPLVKYLKRHALSLTTSEYFTDVAIGDFKLGVQCQDVQSLTYADESFGLCTSTEVFEHVANDRKGFSELLRVLKPNGAMVFTVPLSSANETVERAELREGQIHHELPPEYHGDNIRGSGKVLCFRNYGLDIIQRIESAGFTRTMIISPPRDCWFGYGRPVIVGFKLGN
jgi:SAM-dependent methyltransferase